MSELDIELIKSFFFFEPIVTTGTQDGRDCIFVNIKEHENYWESRFYLQSDIFIESHFKNSGWSMDLSDEHGVFAFFPPTH